MEARTVMVGRGAQRRELAAALDAAASGTPGALLVHGEAGIGKTRLVTEATAEFERQGGLALWGRCLRFGAAESSFQPIGQVLTQWFRRADEEERERVLHRLPVDALAAIAPILGAPAEQGAGRLMPVLATVLERIAERRPTVLIIDDLQWADTTSLDLLAFLVAGFGHGQRLAVLATYRDTDLHDGHRLHGWLADVRRLPGVSELELERLGLPETEELVASLCGEEGVVSRAADVFDRARGNPYLTELLALGPADDALGAGGLRDALLASWHRLDGRARIVAQLLAVGGRPVDLSVLEGLGASRHLTRGMVRAAINEIIAAGIAKMNAAGGIWFHHPLLGEVIATTLASADLREVHSRYADLWEVDTNAPAALRAAHLALHHGGAGHDEEAFVWSLRAADAASEVLAWSEECEHLQRACKLWPRVHSVRRAVNSDYVQLLGRASESAIRAGEYRLALELREATLPLVNGQQRPLAAARQQFRMELLRVMCGVDDFQVVPEILALTQRVPDSPEHAIALSLLARSEFWTGKSSQAMHHVQEALRIAELSGSDEALAWALGVRSQGYTHAGQGIEDAEQAVAHATATGDRLLLVFTAISRANWLQSAGLKGAAGDRTLEVYSALVGTGFFYVGVQLLPAICERLLETGRWVEARDLLREGLSHRVASQTGSGLRRVAADLAAMSGDLVAAQQHVVRARELAPRRNLVGDTMVWAESRVSMAVGDPVAALTLLAEAMPTMRSIDDEGADELLVLAARASADLAAKPGELDNAIAWLEKVDSLRGESPPRFVARAPDDLVHPAWARLFEAEAARCRDGGARRPELWADAVAACAAAGLPWELALCSYWLAQSLLATKGSRAQAAAALREAARIAGELGAAPILADVESLARQSHLSLAEPAAANLDAGSAPALAGLTQREQEVLRHLVAGRTYAEIGHSLFISEKTVSVHVSNLLRKTGTSSRIEVTDLARRLRFR